jgi:site-specific recombinase XerC
MPAHVRAVDLPTGIYWDRNRRHWYTIADRKRIKLGDCKAALADLQMRLAATRGLEHSSLGWLMDQFNASPKFTKLAPRTRRDYKHYRAAIAAFSTKAGKLGTLPAGRLAATLFQGIVDKLEADGTPTKANHWLRYLRRVYNWSIGRVPNVRVNPLQGVDAAEERKAVRVPTTAEYERMVAFAKERGALARGVKGAVAGYLWMMMELMYLCRLRSIEAVTLTDAHELEDGVLTNRRKHSRDNTAQWGPRLHAALDAAAVRRKLIFDRYKRPIPLNPERRLLLVNETGGPISEHAIQESWRNMMRAAIEAGVIDKGQRFGTHGCKHRGVSDTPGNRHDKQEGSGHRSERMMDIYDHEVPVVPTPEHRKPA